MLVFLFVLLSTQGQRLVKFSVLRLRLLHAFSVVCDALLQRLITGVKGSQLLARCTRRRLLVHRRSDVIRGQRQGDLWYARQFLPQLGDTSGQCRYLTFVAMKLSEMGTPACDFLTPQTEAVMPGEPLCQRRQLGLQLVAGAQRTVADARAERRPGQ
ncbi:hypothetical protein D3C78_905270 [compost metagenome]